MKNQRIVSSCCGQVETENHPSEWGICGDCREHCSFVTEAEYFQDDEVEAMKIKMKINSLIGSSRELPPVSDTTGLGKAIATVEAT